MSIYCAKAEGQMSIYTERWNAAHALFVDKIIPAFDLPNVEIIFEGQKIVRSQLVIDATNHYISVTNNESCRYCVYNGDPEFDEGAYDTEEVTAKRIRSSFKLCYNIRY